MGSMRGLASCKNGRKCATWRVFPVDILAAVEMHSIVLIHRGSALNCLPLTPQSRRSLPERYLRPPTPLQLSNTTCSSHPTTSPLNGPQTRSFPTRYAPTTIQLTLTQPLAHQPPPSYSPSTDPSSSASTSTLPPPPFKTKPTNFLTLSSNDDSLRGEFVIDPGMDIPSSMLPPLDDANTDADRKNLCLRSHSGSVQADIWLLGSNANASTSASAKPRRTTLALTSDHGSLRAQVVRPFSRPLSRISRLTLP